MAEYKSTLMVFIDILGFRELLKNESLVKVLEIINEIIKTKNSADCNELLKIETKLISDSLVIFSQVNQERDLTAFFTFVGVVIAKVHKQGNVLTRGCIAYGDHYDNDNIWISPVFVDAYEGESKSAKTARVILHSSALEALKMYPNYRSFFNLDTDGYFYLDYLRHIDEAYKPNKITITVDMSTDLSDKNPLYTSLNLHKEIILNGLLKSNKEVAVKGKYIWIGNYHNQYVSKTNFRNKENLLVDPNLLILE